MESEHRETAFFAGGCFWGLEQIFRLHRGVLDVVSGYMGGDTPNPCYEDVCTGQTGHAETVRVEFDPEQISYEELARLFFEIHDPTQVNCQGPDRGTQYRSAVFYTSDSQRQSVMGLIDELHGNGFDVATQVLPADTFYRAEDYHQNFLNKHPERRACHTRVQRFKANA